MSVTEELRKSEKLLRPLLRENVRLDIQLTDDPAMVLADASQLHLILVNLAVNAQDAMPQGGVLTIRVEPVDRTPTGPAFDGLVKPGPHVLLTVADTREGIPESALPHIFEPFYPRKGANTGTDLGLATVHGIVHQHEGVIDVKSAIGEGTTFSIYLPEVVGETEEVKAPVRSSEGGTERVLLVEDNEAVRRLLQKVLGRAGYDVVAVGTAEEALELFAGSDYACDLLVSDVVLPGMNGRALYDVLEAKRPGLPVLFVSGYSHDVLAETGLPDGNSS